MSSHPSTYSTTPRGRGRPSAFDLNASSASVSSTGGDADLLREHIQESERLCAENFNLKLRVTALEQRLVAMQAHNYSEDFEAELLQARMQAEEKDNKLRQQQEHMTIAVDAIKQLQGQLAEAQAEIQRLRVQVEDAGEMEALRHLLAKSEDKLECRNQRIQDLETELTSAGEERQALRARLDELTNEQQRMETELGQLRQEHQKLGHQRMQDVKQADEHQFVRSHQAKQIEELDGRLQQVTNEKKQMEVKFQTQLKRLEDHTHAQMEKLKKECDKYRNEYMKVNGDREKVQFERERFAMELTTIKEEKTRYQTEWERIAKELERLNGELEAARMQNVKLQSTCEHQAQNLENYRNERESALDSLHTLESEVNEWRKISSEREATVKGLEVRCQNAEAEVKKLQDRLTVVATRNNQTANERIGALERDKNALEAQNYELRKMVSSLQQQLESFESKCQTYENLLNEEAERVKEYKDRLLTTEREIHQRVTHSEQLERQLAQVTNSSVSESVRIQQYSEQIAHVTNECKKLMESLTTERTHLETIQQRNATLAAENQHLTNQLLGLAKELKTFVRFDQDELKYRSLDAILKEAMVVLQRQFKAEADVLIRRWQEQAENTRAEVERLSSRLHSCHEKIATVQQSKLSAKDNAMLIDRSWLKKYENLRSEFDTVRHSLEESLRVEKMKNMELQARLSHTRADFDAMAQARDGTLSDLERDNLELKESNRLLLAELQNRRRSAEHARKQYLQAVAENKDLLDAVDILKNGIMERDKHLEQCKSTIRQMTQQLQRGGPMVEVKHKLLSQLEQTQYMVNETYKKWSQSDLGSGLNGYHDASVNVGSDGTSGWVTQLDDYVARLETLGDRWQEYIQESRDLHRRYAEAWRSTAISFGKGKERPAWVDEVERSCNRQLSESVRVSEWIRAVVEDIVDVFKNTRSKHRGSRANDRAHRKSVRERVDLSPMRGNNANDDALSLEHFNGDFDNGVDLKSNNANDQDVLFINRGKRVPFSTSREGGVSRASASRGGASTIYGHSLASLGRIGDELRAIETKIKTYPDE